MTGCSNTTTAAASCIRSASKLRHRLRSTTRSSSSSSSAIDVSSIPDRPSRFQSIYDESSNWRDWFPAAEYENPWDVGSPRLQPIPDTTPAADYATRHLIQLLQRFHEQHEDRVTTEQCNATLRNLLQSSNRPNATLRQEIAFRADAILENMEIFDTTPVLARLPRPLPKPNRETYNTVLRIFAKSSGKDRLVPDRAAAIVEKMERRYNELQELDMKPLCFHWNCVLLAWKECHDAKKPVHAIKLLLSKANEDATLVDKSSYIHLLRICAHADRSDIRSAKLGASVAVKLWQELFENDSNNVEPLEFTAHFYSHFLQAIRSLERGQVRDKYYDDCFTRAKENGRVNEFVLQEFFVHCRSDNIFDKHLKPYRSMVYGESAEAAKQIIYREMPDSWKNRADER